MSGTVQQFRTKACILWLLLSRMLSHVQCIAQTFLPCCAMPKSGSQIPLSPHIMVLQLMMARQTGLMGAAGSFTGSDCI